MLLTILNGLLPVACGIALGWLAGRMGMLKHADAGVLGTFVIRFALPLALFAGAVGTPPARLGDPALALCLAFGLMGTYLVALAVGRYVFRHDLRTATMQALVCGYPDMAYFGAPILAALFGAAGFLPVLVGNLVTSIVMLPLTIVLTYLAGQAPEQRGAAAWSALFALVARSVGKALCNPIVWLPVLGVACSFGHVRLPGPVMSSVELVAKSAGGTSLFALGLMLFGEKLRINANVLANLALKNVLMPALMVAGAAMFGLTGNLAHQAILAGAVPTATAAAMFALKNGTYTADATATILISTIVGIFTAAALIAWMS